MAKTAGLGDIDERSLARVLEETVLTHAGDQNVGEPIIVEIAHGHAHPVHFQIEASASRDVGKRAVPIIAIKLESGTLLLMLWPVHSPVHSIDEQNVLPSVGIVVEKSAARPECFLAQERGGCDCCGSAQEIAPVHGMFTNPLRMA